MRKKKKKNISVFRQELRRDWNTMKSLPWKKRLGFFWDYYRWAALGIGTAIFCVCLAAHMIWEGQKPCRLRVCVVLNTDMDCGAWFDAFTEELSSDGKPGSVEVNQDQPFDYDNRYYYLHEIEVMTTVSSGRMDAAICNEDMYSYLLALNACLPLDTALGDDIASSLEESGKLVYSTANLQVNEDGSVSEEDGIDGYYAIDLSGTEFGGLYNQPEDGGEEEPLYAVLISNTEHLSDAKALLLALAEDSDG